MPTVEQTGAVCADVVRAHAGSSPCVIMGACLEGKIAFEAAHAFQRAGGNIAFMVIIDAYAFPTNGVGRVGVTALRSLRRIWRGDVMTTVEDTAYIDRLSASLSNYWRLLRWLLVQILRC